MDACWVCWGNGLRGLIEPVRRIVLQCGRRVGAGAGLSGRVTDPLLA